MKKNLNELQKIYSDEPATLTKNFYKRTAMILKKYKLNILGILFFLLFANCKSKLASQAHLI
ncbi:hypothetical protein QUE94_13530 [Lactococcus lactis]|uniref:hypothetical protein n=1 Tax=Lactococcus lactis TaxID=1358 RepID=UPI00259FEA4A|nr:hypothetical protein [Lactococcus lactis]MDM7503501.1 hypothetical protein [Lactococcus lactis]MDM7522734.1 hypothetical protein [Lactococcus lactis]